jgi:hypothetical protein
MNRRALLSASTALPGKIGKLSSRLGVRERYCIAKPSMETARKDSKEFSRLPMI